MRWTLPTYLDSRYFIIAEDFHLGYVLTADAATVILVQGQDSMMLVQLVVEHEQVVQQLQESLFSDGS